MLISARLTDWLTGRTKTLMLRFCWTLEIKCDYLMSVTLHIGTSHQALPIHTTFSDLEYMSRSQQCQAV